MLEKHLWNTFFLCLVVEIQQLALEIRSFPELLYERGDLNNFSKFSDKYKKHHLKVSCQKMFLKSLQNSQKNIYAGVSFLIKLQTGNLKMWELATADIL